MFSRRLPAISLLFSLAALLLFIACGSDPASPGVEPEIINESDVFQFQVSAIENYSGTLNYRWSNTGTMANVDQSSSVSSGEATLTIVDADGNAVYARDLAADGSLASDAGVPGDWTITVSCTRLSGALNFRAEKRTP